MVRYKDRIQISFQGQTKKDADFLGERLRANKIRFWGFVKTMTCATYLTTYNGDFPHHSILKTFMQMRGSLKTQKAQKQPNS